MNHPYKQYENTRAWKTIQQALSELMENQDIEITTREEYVVGFLCKVLYENDFIREEHKASPMG